jgi:ketosteroid isomerase-like protein
LQKNEKLVKDFYGSFKNKDRVYDRFCQVNIEWITMDGMPNGGRYVGLQSVFEEYFPKMLSVFKEFHANPHEFLCIDDQVIVFGWYCGQTKIGKNFIVPFCHVYRIRDNKISQFKQYTDTKTIHDALLG